MIKIDKDVALASLVRIANVRINEYKLKFDTNNAGYLSGKESFNISSGYNSKSVRERLKEKQNNKCCFSESYFVGDTPHVEHFRPKARVDILGTKDQLYPGYYWLAYEWSNLFLCKEMINCKYKRNFFPLVDESLRNRSHYDFNVETSQIIDPSVEDPRDHIKFEREEPVGKTQKGEFNIDFLGLRDFTFYAARLKKIIELEKKKEVIDIGIKSKIAITHPLVAIHLNDLKAAIKPDAVFSSMARDFLKGWPPLSLVLDNDGNLLTN